MSIDDIRDALSAWAPVLVGLAFGVAIGRLL